MNIEQLFWAIVIGMVLGAMVFRAVQLLLPDIKQFWRRLLFKSELLVPYQPKRSALKPGAAKAVTPPPVQPAGNDLHINTIAPVSQTAVQDDKSQ